MYSLHKIYHKALVLVGLFYFSATAVAGDLKVDRVIVLGDTLSDGGSYSQAMWAIGKPRVLFRVLENNPDGSSRIWAESVASNLGLDLKPNVLRGVSVTLFGTPVNPALQISETDIPHGGTNYAELGARVTGTSYFENVPVGFAAASVVNQVDRVLADNNGKLSKHDLIAIWAGSEDAISALVEGDTALIFDGARALAAQVDRLKKHGAKNIIILTVPVTSANIPPRDPNDIISLTLASYYRTFNEEMKKEMAGKNVLVIDTTKLIDATRLDPTRFGFSAVDGVACDNDALACVIGENTNPNEGPFTRSDANHLSQLMNDNVADLVNATLKASSQSASMINSTLGTIRQAGISLERRLVPGAFYYTDKNGVQKKRKKWDIRAFGSVEGGYFEEDEGQVSPGSKAKTFSLIGGGDIALSDKTLVGVNLTFSDSNVDFEDNSGGFDSRHFIGTLYTNVSLTNSIYVNASVSAGHIDLENINRRFSIGTSQESYTGDTSGRYHAARIGIGYNYKSGGWSLNPGVAYIYERLKIRGYAESDGVGSLVFGENTFESSRVSLSLTASYTPKNPKSWKPMLRVSVEHDFNDDDMKINMGFDQDNIGALYLVRPEGTYGTITAGISRNITDETSFSINASTIIGEDGVSGASGGIRIKSRF